MRFRDSKVIYRDSAGGVGILLGESAFWGKRRTATTAPLSMPMRGHDRTVNTILELFTKILNYSRQGHDNQCSFDLPKLQPDCTMDDEDTLPMDDPGPSVAELMRLAPFIAARLRLKPLQAISRLLNKVLNFPARSSTNALRKARHLL